MTTESKARIGRPPNPNGRLRQKSVGLNSDIWKRVEALSCRTGMSQSCIVTRCVVDALDRFEVEIETVSLFKQPSIPE